MDARGAAAAQTAWLRAQMGPHFSRKLLQVTREIEKRISLHDGNPAHRFPILAGSYLTEVCACAFLLNSPVFDIGYYMTGRFPVLAGSHLSEVCACAPSEA